MKEKNGDPDFLVAALGASAGGIHALTSFFEQVPAGSGIAYVVILHLSPDHDSQLSQLLQVHTSLPVMQVTEKIKVAPDHIYVIPPNHHLLMEEDCIAVSPNMQVESEKDTEDPQQALQEILTQMRLSVEQHEFHAEELKASNEALQAMNEELRSSTEELETSREELQKMNEALRTVNQELKVKIEETNLNSNKLENLINSASIGTIFLDGNLRIALFTPAARDIFNLIPGDHGRPLSDITHRLEYKTLIQDVETVLEKLTVMEREINSQQGFTYLMRILPYRTAEGHINGVVITFFDITTRKKAEDDLLALKLAEKALAESEERYRVAMSSAGMGFWDWNITADSVVWNENVYRLLGLPPDSKAKNLQFFLELVHPDDVGTVKQAIQTAIQKMGVYRTEFRITRPDNKQVVWMSAYGRLLEYEEGNAKRMIGVIYDITHHKKLEQQKDEFLTIASHELKTPVTGIKAYTELLLRLFRQAGQEEPIALMEKLDGQVDRLTGLIKSLLDATRIAEGQLPLHKETIDLNAKITNCVQDLQRLSPQHTLLFIPGEIGPVAVDRERICQVITNLISNAVKYSPGAKDVTIATVAFEDGVKVSVQDKGIGIPAELLDKVFDRFFRIGREQVNTFPGMGLGLYISAGIVHRHGGRIVAESTPGEGSLFYFTLPYAGKDE